MHYSLLNATELEQGKLFSYTVSGLEQDMKYDLFLQANNTTISHSYSLGMCQLVSISCMQIFVCSLHYYLHYPLPSASHSTHC